MSLPTIDGLKTIDQIRAEQRQPAVQDLDRNAFLRLFTTHHPTGRPTNIPQHLLMH